MMGQHDRSEALFYYFHLSDKTLLTRAGFSVILSKFPSELHTGTRERLARLLTVSRLQTQKRVREGYYHKKRRGGLQPPSVQALSACEGSSATPASGIRISV